MDHNVYRKIIKIEDNGNNFQFFPRFFLTVKILQAFEETLFLWSKLENFAKKIPKLFIFLKKTWQNCDFHHNSNGKIMMRGQKIFFFQIEILEGMEEKSCHFWDFLLKSMSIGIAFSNFEPSKLRYTLEVLQKKRIFWKILHTLEDLKKMIFFAIFWTKNPSVWKWKILEMNHNLIRKW